VNHRSVNDTTALGRSQVRVTRLGLGCAPLANMYRTLTEDDATAVVDAAWAAGVRYFDTAPHYGVGVSERRLGAALADRPRADYTVSTKVGRLLVPDPDGAGRRDAGFDVPATHRRVWDFSAGGVHRSIDDSLARLGLDRIDLVLLHDPEQHLRWAVEEAYPALHELRTAGMIGAIGVGSTRWQALHRFAVETDVDAVMVAGRYTLLEQPALDTLFPACDIRGISVLNAGVFNSGLLAVDRPVDGLPYEYLPAPRELVDRARAIATVCRRHDTTLPAAALAFAAAHPVIASVVVGAESAEQAARNAALATAAPPAHDLWKDLAARGLLRPDAPILLGVPAAD
jgi:D-threo-aldose 1-dehydrogenase